MLKQFFVVTVRESIYQVDVSDNPSVVKIASAEDSSIDVGTDLISTGDKPYIGILIDTSLKLFDRFSSAVKDGKLDEKDIRGYTGGTSSIVGLFLSEDGARECFGTLGSKLTFDLRWRKKSVEVVSRIEEDGPVVFVSKMSRIRLR